MEDEAWNDPLISERLQLDPLKPSDAAELVDVLSDPKLYRYTGGSPPELEELRGRFKLWAARRSPDGKERWLNWVIRDLDGGRALGTMQATVSTEEPTADIAWVLGVGAQGHGYASEAARCVVEFLTRMGIREVSANIHPDHVASNRVASAIGMEQTEALNDGERVWRLTAPSE